MALDTLDSPELRELDRTQLQTLAKREMVRAIGKTEDIIRRLMHKHPSGVPISEDGGNQSTSPAPQKRSLFKNVRRETPSRSPVPNARKPRADPKGKGKAVAEDASPSPSSSTEALELLCAQDEPVAGQPDEHPRSAPMSHPQVPVEPNGVYRGENARSAAPPFEGQDHDWQADEDDEDDGEACDYVKGAPSHYMVLDTLRQLTTVTNTIPVMETRLAESRCLLKRAESMLEKSTPVARQLTVTREYLEVALLAKMKQKRELWDGTGRMEKPARKNRMEFLRAQRRVEAEKKLAEVNESNRRQGLKPIPLSVFIPESDEEDIESLRTTPTSSRGGSSKRAREESIDAESDAKGSGVDERKKRARCP